MHRLHSTRSEASVRCGLQAWGTGEPRADSRGADHRSGRVDACRVWGSAGSEEGLVATPPTLWSRGPHAGPEATPAAVAPGWADCRGQPAARPWGPPGGVPQPAQPQPVGGRAKHL